MKSAADDLNFSLQHDGIITITKKLQNVKHCVLTTSIRSSADKYMLFPNHEVEKSKVSVGKEIQGISYKDKNKTKILLEKKNHCFII